MVGGVYAILPLGQRVLNNICAVIHRRLQQVGAQEVSLPILQPREWWEEGGSGRIVLFDRQMMSLEADGRRFCLSPTSEELIVKVMGKCGPLSYRNLPVVLYHIGQRFRSGAKAHGLHRSVEFPLHELYAFATGEAEAEAVSGSVADAYRQILTECGVAHVVGPETTNVSIGHSSTNFYATPVTSSDRRLLCCDECGRIADPVHEQADGASTESKRCAACDAQCYERRALQVAQVSKLADRYTAAFKLTFLSAEGVPKPAHMCGCGVSIYRTLVSCLEQNCDERGIIWPTTLAPFHVTLVSIQDKLPSVAATSKALYEQLLTAGLEVLWDDRDAHAGEKLAHADLLGMPLRLVVGPTGLRRGEVELTLRRSGERIVASQDNILPTVKGLLEAARAH